MYYVVDIIINSIAHARTASKTFSWHIFQSFFVVARSAQILIDSIIFHSIQNASTNAAVCDPISRMHVAPEFVMVIVVFDALLVCIISIIIIIIVRIIASDQQMLMVLLIMLVLVMLVVPSPPLRSMPLLGSINVQRSTRLLLLVLLLLRSGHGESFESKPNECIGNNGYQPPIRLPTKFSLFIDSSAPPNPWLCSKPRHFCHTIITRLRPKTSAVCDSSKKSVRFFCLVLGKRLECLNEQHK